MSCSLLIVGVFCTREPVPNDCKRFVVLVLVVVVVGVIQGHTFGRQSKARVRLYIGR